MCRVQMILFDRPCHHLTVLFPERWEAVSVVLTTELLIVTEAVFPWLLTSKHRPLTVRHVHRLDTLENLVCESCIPWMEA